MTAFPGLNWNVLRVVAFWADRSTCATLMLSCRFFYHGATKAILYRPIYLRNDHQAAAFLLFVRIDSGSRLRYVRDLSRGFCQQLTASTLDSLVQSMSAMTGLERLKIRDGEDFLQRYPALADVIGKHMTCLRHLEIARVGHLTWALLESLQCSLVSIALDWTGDDRELFDGADGDLSVYYHFVSFLVKWAPTLEELAYENE